MVEPIIVHFAKKGGKSLHFVFGPKMGRIHSDSDD